MVKVLKMRDNINSEIGKFFKEYNLNNYGIDYNMKVDLTYKYPIKKESMCRSWIGKLKKFLNKKDVFISGIFVNEYDSNFSSLHNHLLMYSDKDYYLVEGYIFNFWNKIGSCRIEKYNSDLDYSYYLSKHINKTENNVFDFIENM